MKVHKMRKKTFQAAASATRRLTSGRCLEETKKDGSDQNGSISDHQLCADLLARPIMQAVQVEGLI